MANWKYRLDLVQEWKKAKANEISSKELGQLVAKKVRALPPFAHDGYLQGIVIEFDELPHDATLDDFDDVLKELYDWADQEVPPCGKWPRNAMYWVATF